MLSRQLPPRPLPVAPVPIGYCGRNRRFGLRIYFHIEQSLEPHLYFTRKPNPLAVLRFGDSPIARQQLSGIPQDGRATGVNRPASYPARCLASCPSVVPAIARKIHHPAPQHPRQRLAGQPTRRVAMFASQLARRASGFLRNISPDDLQEIHRHDFNPDSPKHEFIHTVANARSRKATPSSSGISAAAASCSFQQPDTVP